MSRSSRANILTRSPLIGPIASWSEGERAPKRPELGELAPRAILRWSAIKPGAGEFRVKTQSKLAPASLGGQCGRWAIVYFGPRECFDCSSLLSSSSWLVCRRRRCSKLASRPNVAASKFQPFRGGWPRVGSSEFARRATNLPNSPPFRLPVGALRIELPRERCGEARNCHQNFGGRKFACQEERRHCVCVCVCASN